MRKMVFFLVAVLVLLDLRREISFAAQNEAKSPVVVVIDAGHGGKNEGGIFGEYIEKELTLAVAEAMREELEKYEGIEVYMTRTVDVDIPLEKRVRYAKSVDADFFFCLHFNMSENHDLYGTECWVSAFGDCYARGYDFSVFEMELLTGLGLYDRGIKTRIGKKGEDYYGIIRHAREMDLPSVIIEHCHLDHPKDQAYVDHDEWLKRYGALDATAVAKYFGLRSEELGVDYSTLEWERTKIPEEPVYPDNTEPDVCEVISWEADRETGMLSVTFRANDAESRMLYYTYSLDGGEHYEMLRPWPGQASIVEFYAPLPEKEECELVVAAYNLYNMTAYSEPVAVAYAGEPIEEGIAVGTPQMGEESAEEEEILPAMDTEAEQDYPESRKIALIFMYIFIGICVIVLGVLSACFPERKTVWYLILLALLLIGSIVGLREADRAGVFDEENWEQEKWSFGGRVLEKQEEREPETEETGQVKDGMDGARQEGKETGGVGTEQGGAGLDETGVKPNGEEIGGEGTEQNEEGTDETGITQSGGRTDGAGEELSGMKTTEKEEAAQMADSKAVFYEAALSEEIKGRITGSSYPREPQGDISYEELSYLHVLHYDFDGNVREGEMLCNKRIAGDLLAIFEKLYEAKYPIEKIRLIDEYGGDDEASMEDNNTSCFNYRAISGKKKLSNHSYGMAVDINPLYNPYVTTRDGKTHIEPTTAEPYVDRMGEFPHKIDGEDLCCKLFKEHGFTWGGDWKSSKDYQHFEK